MPFLKQRLIAGKVIKDYYSSTGDGSAVLVLLLILMPPRNYQTLQNKK